MRAESHPPGRWPAVLLLLLVAACRRTAPGTPDAGPSTGDRVAAAVVNALAFEGEIDVETKPAGTGTITYFLKGPRVRVETSGAAMVFDGDAGRVTILYDSLRRYSTMPVPATPPDAGAIAMSKTGRTDRIAGYPCEEWEIKTALGRSELCATTSIRVGAGAQAFVGGGVSVLEALRGGMGFPLRTRWTDASGRVVAETLVKRVEAKSVADAKFEIPAGYTPMGLSPSPVLAADGGP